MAVKLPNTPYRYCKLADHGPRGHTKGVVIHDIEGTAASAEAWFRNPQAGGIGAHVIVGLDTVVQLVDLDRKCWHAVGANTNYIGIEHEGRASDSLVTWVKRRRQRKLSANRTGWICFHYRLGLPKRGVNVFAHADGGEAWGGHHDPGKGFPWLLYIAAARRSYRNLKRSNGKKWTRG